MNADTPASNLNEKEAAGILVYRDMTALTFLGENHNFVRHRRRLPIYQHREEIIQHLLHRQVRLTQSNDCSKIH